MRPSVNLFFLSTLFCHAEPSAKLDLPDPTAWTGQRLSFSVELRAEGIFSAAPSFDLPDLPNTVIVKVGNPVLSSQTEGGTEVFGQRHEFALFSQTNGTLDLPPITARFSHKKGYTGPDFDAEVTTEPATLTIRRPPGSEDLGFLVTTPSLTIKESWDPKPGPLEVGAVLKRTITQDATELTGMALAPAPATAPDGIRVYDRDPEINDKTERGQFSSQRRETITYLVQQPGLHTLPALRYDWWNPKTEQLESKTLPAVTFTATAPPAPPPKPSPARFLWLLLSVALLTAIVFCRRPLGRLGHRFHAWIDPPPRRATRAFLRACRHNDALAAERTWARWQALHPGFVASPKFANELLALHRHLYGPVAASNSWTGAPLATAFRESRRRPQSAPRPSPLPPLNPSR